MPGRFQVHVTAAAAPMWGAWRPWHTLFLWLRAGLPDPCVFWSSRVRHLLVSLLVSVNSRASADLYNWVLASSLCNWNTESRYTLWHGSACSRLLGRSIGYESSLKNVTFLDAIEVESWIWCSCVYSPRGPFTGKLISCRLHLILCRIVHCVLSFFLKLQTASFSLSVDS